MSAVPGTVGVPSGGAAIDLGVIRRQIVGILRLEMGKNLLGRRALGMYFLAFAPVPFALLWAAWPGAREGLGGPTSTAPLFANAFTAYIHFSLYMSALLLFMSLFRSEIMEKSLHYYLLTPVRREVLVVGKYVSALVTIIFTFSVSTTVLYLLSILPWGLGEMSQYLMRGSGLSNLIGYLSIVALGSAGYGAVFLLAGLFFRNPIVPASLLWIWEAINPFLPNLLKKLSVVHYLQSLKPIPITSGPFAFVGDPTPAWIAVPGVVLFTLGVLFIACLRARKMEISYGED